MQSSQASAQLVQEELERVLASPGFARNERLSRFLRLAVEWKLADRAEELKESILGVEVFGRNPGYDPKRDPVVRTEASRLRARLAEYYGGEGADRPLLIDIPKGGYTPEWRNRDSSAAAIATASPATTRPPIQLQSRTALLLALVAVVTVAAGWRWTATERTPISIAVLPLRNLSESSSTNFFSDGLTGELIRNLSIIDGLAVRSQASSFAFKNKVSNIQDTGKELGADYILQGSVLRAGNQLRVQVQLVKVAENRYVWSETYDRESSEVFKIQDEISRGIVNSLRLKLGNGRRRYETSVEAYDLYLKARAMQINTVFGDPRSIDLFEKAIEKDPAFAPAYAGVAIAYAERSEMTHPKLSDVQDDLVRMRATAEKALELDPLLPEAHEAQAMSCARDAKWEQAEIHFIRATQLDPNNSKLRSHYGCNYFLALGRIEDGLAQLRIAERSDPLSAQVHFRIGFMLISAGSYPEAESQCAKMQTDPMGKNQCLGRALLFRGKIDEAIPVLEKSNSLGYLSYALARAGRIAEAEKIYESIAPNTLAKSFYWAATGNKAELLTAMSNAVWAGPVILGRVLTFPEFALVRGDAKLAELRRAAGLPE